MLNIASRVFKNNVFLCATFFLCTIRVLCADILTITIVPTSNCAALSSTLLADGSNIIIDSCQYRGCAGAAGTFAMAPMGLDNGIILTTGAAIEATPPNLPADLDNNCGGIGCLLCDNFVDGLSTDYSLLRIFFRVAAGMNSIRVRFVFGTEEYPYWIGSRYNDVMAIYLDGELPENQIAFDMFDSTITINGPFFESGRVVIMPVTHFPGDTIADLAYNGCTPLLEARGCIDTTSTYHTMTFVVCDVEDAILDSGLLLAQLRAIYSNPCGGAVCMLSVDVTATPDALCNRRTNLRATVTGAYGHTSFSWWSEPAGFSSTVQNPLTPVLECDTKFFVRVTDSLGCTSLDSVFVNDTCCHRGAVSRVCPAPSLSFSACNVQRISFLLCDTAGYAIDTMGAYFTQKVFHASGSIDSLRISEPSPRLRFFGIADSFIAEISGNWLDGDSVIIRLDSLFNLNHCKIFP